MKVAFFGTSEYATEVLEALVQSPHQVVLVVTQQDTRRDRGHKLHFTPVKEKALELELPIYQPEDVNQEEAARELEQAGADIFVVVSFGSILKKRILEIPPCKSINVHPSLLPLYRGAAPIQRCIMDGCRKTGVTIMEMDTRLDAGAIILQEKIDLDGSWDYGRMSEVLAALGGRLLIEALDRIEAGTDLRIPQEEELHTYAKKILKEDKYLSFDQGAEEARNRIRGLVPKVTPLVLYRGHLLGILKAELADCKEAAGVPGQILEIDKEKGIKVKCREGCLWLLTLKPEGKKAMHFRDFLNGNKAVAGEVFEAKKEN